jgi:predicted lipoprotein with Yx(FWY)xxD motif
MSRPLIKEGVTMKRSDTSDTQLPHRRGRFGRAAMAAVAAAALTASITALALASSGSPTVSAAHSKLGRVVVNGQGRTLYVLSPETVHHLLCKSKACFDFWPPLTVGSGKAKLTVSGGVHGRLRILHRNGIFQVTLNGMPLYRYAGDHGKGEVNGQDIHSFGGVWHVIAAAAGAHGKGSKGSPAGSGAQTSTSSSSNYPSATTSYSYSSSTSVYSSSTTPAYSTTSTTSTHVTSSSTSSTGGGYGGW